MTLSTKIEVLRILHLFAVGLHTFSAVARSLCVSWAFVLTTVINSGKHLFSIGHVINICTCIALVY